MDNVTHSVIGVAIGHSLWRWARVPGARDGASSEATADAGSEATAAAVLGAAVLAAVFASNAPDLDVLGRYVLPWARHDGLGFLLQHRGYSHSFLAAPVFALGAAALARWLTPKARRAELSWRGLFAIGLVGDLLHLGADSWNDYGVHPFSPFYNRWFYGDFIFIVEPMLWFAFLPLAIWNNRTRLGRAVAALLWLGMLGGVWFGPVSGWLTSLWLTFWAGAWLAVGYRLRGKSARLPAWGAAWIAAALTLAFFAAGSQLARTRVAAAAGAPLGASGAARAATAATQTMIGTSPFPGNPLLWRGIVAEVDAAGRYSARQFTLSLAPGLFEPPRDFFRSGGPVDSVLDRADPGLRWLASFRAPAAELVAFAERYCRVRGVLGFVRFPYWHESDGVIEVGDLRYDRGGRGFSRVEVADGSTERCPEYYTPWIPPISSMVPIK